MRPFDRDTSGNRDKYRSHIMDVAGKAESTSMPRIIAGTAMTMVGFAIGLKISRGLGFKANLGLGRAAVRTIKHIPKVASIMKRHGARGAAKRAVNIGKKLRSIATNIRTTEPGLESMKEYITSTRAFNKRVFTRISKGRGEMVGGVTARIYDYRLTSLLGKTKLFQNNPIGRWVERAKRFDRELLDRKNLASVFAPAKDVTGRFGGTRFSDALQARAHRWGSDFLSAAPIYYAMDKAMGIHEDGRKWHDPRSAANWMAWNSAIDIGMQALMPAAGHVGKFAFGTFGKAIGRQNIEDFMSSSLRFASKADVGMTKVTTAFVNAFDQAKHAKQPGRITKPIRTISNFAKSMKVMGREFQEGMTRIAKGEMPVRKRGTDLQRRLRYLKMVKKFGSVPGRQLSDLDINAVRNSTLEDLRHDPGGFSKYVNSFLKMSDENISLVEHQRRRVAGTTGLLYRGRGAISYKGTDYTFNTLHPSAIADNFLKFMGERGPGLLGIRQLANYLRRDKFSVLSAGTQINLGIQYTPNEIRAGGVTAINDEGTVAVDRLRRLADGIPNEKKKKETIANLMAGIYQVQDNEKGFYINDRLYLIRHMGEDNSVAMYRLGMDPNKNAYLKYGAVPIENAGNWQDVVRRQYTDAHYGRTTAGFRPDSLKPEAREELGVLELGSKQRRTYLDRIKEMFYGKWTNPLDTRSFLSDEYMFDPHFMVRLRQSTQQEKRSVLQTTRNIADKFDTIMHKDLFQNKDTVNVLSAYDTGLRKRAGGTYKLGEMMLDLDHKATAEEISNTANLFMDQFRFHKGSRYSPSDTLTDEMLGIVNRMKDITPGEVDALYTPIRRVTGYGKINTIDAYNNLVLRRSVYNQGNADEFIQHMLNNSAIQQKAQLEKSLNFTRLMSKMDTFRPDRITSMELNNKVEDIYYLFNEHKEQLTSFARKSQPVWGLGTSSPKVNVGQRIQSPNLFVVRDKAEKAMIDPATGKWFMGSMNVTEPFKTAMNSRRHITGVDILGSTEMEYDFLKYDQPMTLSNVMMQNAANVVNDTANWIGLGFEENSIRGMKDIASKIVFKRVLPAVGAYYAWQGADAFFDDSGLFEKTALGSGLTPFAGNVLARMRLGAQNILDTTGATSLAQHMEEWLPGSVSSPLAGGVRGIGVPIAGLGLGFKMGGPTGAMIGGSIGAAMGLLSAGGPLGLLGMWDVTKTRSELLDEYSGRKEVPIRRGRFWLLGSGNVMGRDVMRYEPNWYAQLRSKYMYTPTMYGSRSEKLLSPLDANHYIDKHYYSRPYMETGTPFENIPLIGQLIPFGGQKIHEEDYKYLGLNAPLESNSFTGMGMENIASVGALYDESPSSITPLQDTFSGISGEHSLPPVSKGSFSYAAQHSMLQAEELLGLRGWAFQTMRTGVFAGPAPYANRPVLATGQEMSSFSRQYWDMEMGGMLTTNEIIRRFIMREPGWMQKASGGIPNMMPSWMPDEYKVGDPYTKLPKGEMRLPGAAYTTLHDVKFTTPLEAEMFGWNTREQVARMTGYGLPLTDTEKYEKASGTIKDLIAQQLSGAQQEVVRKKTFFNPYMNLSGTADIVRRMGESTQLLNIRVVGDSSFNDLSTQRMKDEAEMNAVLNIGKQQYGSVMYVNAESGETKSIGITADRGRFVQDLQRVEAARSMSLHVLKGGPTADMNLSNTFSRADRLRILADVAPYSNEYRETLKQVRQMGMMGLLDEPDMEKVVTAVEQRQKVIEGFEFDRNRFYNMGTPVTPDEAMSQAQIKREYGLIERSIGAGWEYLTNELYSPIHTKLLGKTTALEKYKRNEVFGRDVKLWENPVKDFINPYVDQMLGNDDFVQGFWSGAAPGILLGPTYAVVGGSVGTIAAGFNQTFGASIPDYRQKERDIVQTMDMLEYEKYSQLYSATGSQEAQRKMQSTMAYTTQNPGATMGEMLRALPARDRTYFAQFTRAGTLEEREEINKVVPEYMRRMLQQQWNGNTNTGLNPTGKLRDTENPHDMIGVDPWLMSQNIPDLTVKVMKNEGLDAHDVGLGFYSQEYRTDRLQATRERGHIQSSYGFDLRSMIAGITGSSSITVMQNSSPSTTVELLVE